MYYVFRKINTHINTVWDHGNNVIYIYIKNETYDRKPTWLKTNIPAQTRAPSEIYGDKWNSESIACMGIYNNKLYIYNMFTFILFIQKHVTRLRCYPGLHCILKLAGLQGYPSNLGTSLHTLCQGCATPSLTGKCWHTTWSRHRWPQTEGARHSNPPDQKRLKGKIHVPQANMIRYQDGLPVI